MKENPRVTAETGFKIDDRIYEHPFATWDLDDAEILYNKTGLVIEDWVLADEDDKEIVAKFRDPKVVRTMAAIAYWKQHKDESFDSVFNDVGSVRVSSLYESLFAGDDSPPESTTEPDKPFKTSSVEKNVSSGIASTTSSGQPDARPEPIGTPV